MNQKRTFLLVGILLLGIAGICGLCTTTSLGAVALNWLSHPTKTSTPGITRTLTMLGSKTPTPRPTRTASLAPDLSATAAVTQTAVISPTLQAPDLTPGQIITATLPDMTLPPVQAPLITATATLTPFPPHPSPTPGPVVLNTWCVPWNTPSTQARVLQIIDGVTIKVQIDREVYHVRYIGVAVPESPYPNTPTLAQAQNRALVEGKSILLVQDNSQTDEDGRLLRYVIAGGVFINLKLVESGYAVAQSQPPDVSCDHVFKQAEDLAHTAGRGLWLSTPTPTRTPPPPTATLAHTGSLMITKIYYQGSEWQEPEEYVEFRNTSPWLIQLQGWTLNDDQNHVFIFPSFVLGAGEYCRVYTNEYHPTSCGFSFYSLSPIWDDVSECAYLKDSEGKLIDTFCYE